MCNMSGGKSTMLGGRTHANNAILGGFTHANMVGQDAILQDIQEKTLEGDRAPCLEYVHVQTWEDSTPRLKGS